MNTRILSCFAAAVVALGFAGCASEPTASLPRIHYPVTYNVPIGNTQVASAYGPQNLNVSATQDVTVQPDATLYYQVNSPIGVTLYIYAKDTAGERGSLLGTMQGTTFSSTINPSTGVLEFAFAPTLTNTNGTLQFTLSDTPFQQVLPSTIVPSAPVTTQQTTTTQTTTTTSSVPPQN